MSFSRFFKTVLPLLFSLFALNSLSAQIWQENFSGANQGWTENFTDCDGVGSAVVNNGRFEVNDMEGLPCCPTGASTGGGNDNEWVTNEINIQGFCNVGISVQYGFIGTFECSAGGPYFGCTNDPFIDNGHDQIVFQYSLNSGPWTQFLYVCGGQTGTASIGSLSGNTLRVRILPANKSTAETYWFDNVVVSGQAAPTVNPVADVVKCAGQPVMVNFSGTGSPTFNWTNNNTSIGLGASGSGNLNFPTPAGTTQQQIGTITVTPTAGGCSGQPINFNVTVNPVPTVDQPANVIACPGQQVDIIFTGNSNTATYNWVVNGIPFFPPSGSGNISGVVPNIPFAVSGTITVTPTENGCNGTPKTFSVSIFPSPTANLTLTSSATVCQGQPSSFSVSLTGGAPYTFIYAINGVNQPPVTTNNNPYNFNLTLSADATITAVSVASNNGNCTTPANGSANLTVIPTPTATLAAGSATGCQGQPLNLNVTFNGSDNYTLGYTINNVAQSPITTAGPSYTLMVDPPLGTGTIKLTTVNSNGCPGTATGTYTATTIPLPTAAISGSPNICSGQNANLTVNLSGTAPFKLTYSLNGTVQPVVTTNNTNYTISGTYSSTTLVLLESVTSGTCTGNTIGSATVTVTPQPTATLANNTTTICSGQSVQMPINFVGTAPFNLVYSINNVNQPSVVTSMNPHTLTVSPTTGTNTYKLVTVASGSCNGTATGTYAITVGPPPTASLSGTATVCAGQKTDLKFNFTGPTPPYTVQYTANGVAQPSITATANPFNFSVNPFLTTNYAITGINAGSCTGTFSGSAVVTVSANSTADLEAGTDTICSGTTDTLNVTFGGAPGPYTFIYAVNGVNQDTITTSDFIFRLPLLPLTGRDTFTLVSVTSPTCTGGTVTGMHVYLVKPTPVTDLSGDLSICAGNTGNLIFHFSGDTVWTANYTMDGIPQPPLVTIKNPDTIKVTPLATTTYILTDVSSSNGCISTLQDTVIMEVNPGATAMIDSIELTFCEGKNDTTLVTLGGGSPYTLSYSINGVPQPPVIVNGSSYQIIRSPIGGASDTIQLINVTSPGCFVSNVSGQKIIHVTPLTTAKFVGGSAKLCNGGTVKVPLEFTGGAGPWTITYTANGVVQPTYTTITNPDTLQLMPTDTTTYILTVVSSNGCIGTASGQFIANVGDSLSAVLSGGGQVCQNGNGATLLINFSGQGPFTYQYTANNVLQPAVTTSNNPEMIKLNPPNGVIYSLVKVSNASCQGNSSGAAVIFVFTPPTAEMSGTKTVCDSTMSDVVVDFTGTGPFTIFYTIDGVPQAPDTTFEDPYFIPVKIKKTTNFVLTGVQSPGCTGSVLGAATITVDYTPIASNLSVDCNPVSGQYIVSFNTTGVPPFKLISGSGTFTGNTFTSSPITNGMPYSFIYQDSKNCNNVTVSGLEDCTCKTNAGTMSSSLERVCEDQQVAVPTTLGSVLDNNDTLYYILHKNPGTPPGQIFATNSQPIFTFQPGMMVDSTYYISAIAGDKLANGQVDPNDLCMQINTGTPVVFHKIPIGELVALDTSLCPGEPLDLTIKFSSSAVNYGIALDSAGVKLPWVTNITANPYSFTIVPFQSATIKLDSISDNFCPHGIVKGEVKINLVAPPTLKDVKTICNYADATYTVTFTVASGIPPYNVTGGLTGTFMDSLFTSDPVAWGTPFFGLLDDGFDCGVDTIQGIGNCACITDAGTMNSLNLLKLCAGDTATVAHNNNQILDGSDLLAFILHDLPDSTLGSILAFNNTPKFGFDPNTMVLGKTYYISPIAGNFNGFGGIDLSEPCFDSEAGTPVVWLAPPTAMITDTFDVCPGVQKLIPIALTGQAPYMITYTNNGTPVNVTALSNNFGILATLQQSTTYILVSVKDANCTGTASGQTRVNVHQPPDIQNKKVTCSPDNLTYVLEFDITKIDLGPGAVSVTGNIQGTYNETTGHFTSNPIPRTLGYAMSATDVLFNCGQDTINGVSGCPCPTKAGTMPQTPFSLCIGDTVTAQPALGFVLEPGDTLVYALISGNPANPGSWTVLATGKTPKFAYNALTMTPGTTYLIVAVAANKLPLAPGWDINDPCFNVTAGSTVVWRVPPTANISGNTSICKGNSATLTLTFTGTGPFNYSYSDGSTTLNGSSSTNTATITVTPSANTTYTLTNVAGAGSCAGTVTGSATVNINPAPTASLTGNFTLCAGENVNFPITFTGTGPFKFVYAVNGTQQAPLTSPTNTFFISTNNVQAPQTFTLVSVQDANCPGTVSGQVQVSVNPPPTAGLTGNKTLCEGDSAILTLNLAGATTYDVTISGGLTPIVLKGVSNNAQVTVKPTTTTTYTITAVIPTGNSCTPTITTGATVIVTTLAATATVSNYGGFGVSCPGQQDGSITINPIGGTPPFTAIWNPANNGLNISNLDTGTYTVIVTDLTGCRFLDTFQLNAPPGMQLRVLAQAPKCFGETNGSLTITDIIGGSGPFSLTINDTVGLLGPTLPSVYGPLPPGDYKVVITDANGCEAEEVAIISMPPALMLELGTDKTISLGDSTVLSFFTNALVLDTFIWSPRIFLRTPDSVATWAKPPETQTYKMLIRDEKGCIAEDQITVIVNDEGRVYIPNVISPASFTFNDIVTVYAGAEVKRVRSFRIFDRWGDQVFVNDNFLPNEESAGWNGRVKGQDVNPGVFVYVAEVEYFDGSVKIFKGDVTVIR